MIIKIYIRKHVFHLPRKQENLTDMIKEKFYKRKPLVKSGIAKMYRISDIESEEIKYEKNVNIFLVNLYLLALENEGKLKDENDIKITLSDENIIEELSEITNSNLNNLSIEEIEEEIHTYLSGEKGGNPDSAQEREKEESIEVEFSIDWVKKMDKKLRE
jgi:hypothetical protein